MGTEWGFPKSWGYPIKEWFIMENQSINGWEFPWVSINVEGMVWLIDSSGGTAIAGWFIEGSLEVKLPTSSDNMDRWKAEQGRGREKRKIRRKKSRRERIRRKKMQMREKVGKSRSTVFFQWFVALQGRKVGSLKRRVRSSWREEKWKIARRCGAKHISTSKCTKHLVTGTLRCRESARRCGAKHISKSTCTKH